MKDQQQYKVRRGSKEQGPISADQLRELATKGVIRSSDMIRRTDSDKWVLAQNVSGLEFKEVSVRSISPPPYPNPSNDNWYICTESVTTGPFTRSALAAQQIDAATYVWHPTMSDWVLARDVAELCEIVRAVTPPPPPSKISGIGDERSTISDSRLSTKAKKIVFSQDKYRRSFDKSVCKHFRRDEFVLADTYGPREYYVATTARLLVCEVNSVFYSNSLGGVLRSVDLSDVTRIMTWSELYYPAAEYSHPIMAMGLETFKGDVRIEVNAFDSNPGFFKDPFFFGAMLEQAVRNIELGKRFEEAELYYVTCEELSD